MGWLAGHASGAQIFEIIDANKAKIRDKVDRIVPLSYKWASGMENRGKRKPGGKLYI